MRLSDQTPTPGGGLAIEQVGRIIWPSRTRFNDQVLTPMELGEERGYDESKETTNETTRLTSFSSFVVSFDSS
jgi:hypothetical protein